MKTYPVSISTRDPDTGELEIIMGNSERLGVARTNQVPTATRDNDALPSYGVRRKRFASCTHNPTHSELQGSRMAPFGDTITRN